MINETQTEEERFTTWFNEGTEEMFEYNPENPPKGFIMEGPPILATGGIVGWIREHNHELMN